MKLPNAEQAVVDEAKLTRYLLDLTHPSGGPKAIFFLAHGFSLSDWPELRTQLLRHGLEGEVTGSKENAYGLSYVVEGEMQTPDGRSPIMRTVWEIRWSETVPRLVSAYPRGRRRRR